MDTFQDVVGSIQHRIHAFNHQISQIYQKIDHLRQINNPVIENLFSIDQEYLHGHSKCNDVQIIITGTPGVGKSSYINQLIDYPLLPTNFSLSNSCIWKIYYSQEPRVIIQNYPVNADKGDNSNCLSQVVQIEINDYQELQAIYKSSIFTKKSDFNCYKIITLYWPLAALKENISIIEITSSLWHLLADKISSVISSSYLALIYILDATLLIDQTIKQINDFRDSIQQLNNGIKSHHIMKSMLFACNKMDLINADRNPMSLSTYATLHDFLSKSWIGSRKQRCYNCISITTTDIAMAAFCKSSIQERLLHINDIFNYQISRENSVKIRNLKEYINSLSQNIQFLQEMVNLKMNHDPTYEINSENFRLRLCELESKLKKPTRKILNELMSSSNQIQRMEMIILDYCRKDQVHADLFHWQECDFHDFCWFQDMYSYAQNKVATKLLKKINESENIDQLLMQWRHDVLDDIRLYFNPFSAVKDQYRQQQDDHQNLSEWMKDQIHHWKDELPTLFQAMTIPAMLSFDCGYLGLATVTVYFIYNAYNIKPRLMQVLQATSHKMFHDLVSSPIIHLVRREQDKLLQQQLDSHLISHIETTLKAYEQIYRDISDDDMSHSIISSFKSILPQIQLIHQNLKVLDILYIEKFEFSSLDVMDYQTFPDHFVRDSDPRLLKCRIQHQHYRQLDVHLRHYNYQIEESNVDEILTLSQSLRKMDHQNVGKLQGILKHIHLTHCHLYFTYPSTACTLREFLNGSSDCIPAHYSSDFTKQLSAYQSMLSLATDICQGLAYIHERGFIHCHLTLDYVLLTSTCTAVICDIGSPKVENWIFDIETLSHYQLKLMQYMAPEILHRQIHNGRSDIYSFGLLLWEMWYGLSIDCHIENQSQTSRSNIIEMILQQPPPSLDITPIPEETFRIFVAQCLYAQPELRPSIQVCQQILYELRRRACTSDS
ncbi:Tyrosine-protein kinase TXK [Trichoplax sp. H2]|nr:Tyrosine-protein kinase TXK [Trichoplax sp. H2]|eukprot:RDD39007.1 Tyrosine-protein kinase TXK [Trichoplax sp. H2]